jgi:hypothetical protein
MRKPVVTKLSDEFGDYRLTIVCRGCGHSRTTEPHALARIFGWETRLTAIAPRLRCSKCSAKDCDITVADRKRPRGATINRG